ncbi:MAG: A/G-specific adenine glycosylase [Candidatus Moraniibacteriota bacterium]
MSIRRDKIAFFERQLMDFFRKAGRAELPWRKSGITAYEVWVSEIMLQQTQVARVIGYYTRFLDRFPTIESLAQASWEEFLPYYAGLGYYARGRNMLRAAEIIVNEYGGVFPRDAAKLVNIPGIGPYTAAAIMSFAYGDRHLAWDTNLRRVVGRFFFGTKQALIDTVSFEEKFVTPRKSLNGALMDFGSALCVARPKCEACPVRAQCRYYREGGKQEFSQRKPKTKSGKSKVDWSTAEVVVILHDKHRLYYSSKRMKYSPFVLPAGYNTRAGIKDYFDERYGLTLAVRPPHEKRTEKGKARIFVNAQILLGAPTFRTYSAEEVHPTSL